MLDQVAGGFADVSGILAPRSVAVIGASDRPGNLGGDTVRRLRKFGFPGPVWAVNPSSTEVSGVPCYPSLAKLPAVPDLIIMAIPASAIGETIAEAAALGVRNGIAYAGGFADAGAEGMARQQALAELCREYDFRLCGPNCVGVINTVLPATLTFATVLHEVDTLQTGVISMVSQSGGIGTNAFSVAQEVGFGFRYLVSSGNEAAVNFADYLYALACDDGTRVIAAYLEGVSDGPKFAHALAEARRRGKPVVMVKAGTTSGSARAAQAHTGALVGEDRVFDAVLQEMGVMRAYSVEEMVDVAVMVAGLRDARMPAGPGVGVVTFGGGNGVLAVDQCAQAGLTTPALRPDGVAKLKPLLVSVASAANPLDLTPTTAFRPESLAQLPEALSVFAAEPTIDSLLFIAGGLASKGVEIADVMHDIWQRSPKPVTICWPTPPKGIVQRLAERGVCTYLDPARAIRAMSRLAAHSAVVARPVRRREPALTSFDWPAQAANAKAGDVISEHDAHRILRAAGLSVAAGELAKSAADAVRAATAIGLPVAMKGISPKVTHRAAAGLLAVDLRNVEDVRDAAAQLFARAGELGVALDGVYVQRMQPGGVELLVSAFRDPIFGPVVTCGTGGGMTELIGDIVAERAPVSADTAASMIGRLRIAALARDQDGRFPADAAADFIARLSRLAAAAPWSKFVIEVNPVKWSRSGAVAVDGLIIVEEP
jgi:acetate---CoA ligase (ADP-forming)